MNETMKKFGYPDSLIREYDDWVVLLRPKQPTVGSLILCNKSEASRFSELSSNAYKELGTVIKDIESTLSGLFNYDKMNYLMLMMKDKNVHFHVIPRYENGVELSGHSYSDTGWPGQPDMSHSHDLDNAVRNTLLNQIKGAWGK